MAADKELRARWKTPAGKRVVQALEQALRTGVDKRELSALIASLPRVGEVAPALDLRGVELPGLIAIRPTDLSGTRFDSAALNWSFGGSVLRGAVFDGADGANVHFGGSDLTGSSFVGARLPGAVFLMANLSDANLTRIHMPSGQLKSAVCRNARFTSADLRMVWAADADLRSADLREANLVGASLGGAIWDTTTRLDGARLSWEGTPAELATYALGQGATLQSEKADWQLALIDATREAMKQQDQGGSLAPVIERLTALRSVVESKPDTLWANILRDELTPAQWAAVQTAVRSAALNMGLYLDSARR